MPTPTRPDPRPVYQQRLDERRRAIAAEETTHRRLGNFRLAIAAIAAAMVWMALAGQRFSIAWVGVPVVLFVLLAVLHERLLRRLDSRRRAAQFYEKALARLDGTWAGTGDSGARYLDPVHLYAADLDIFGTGSLFELLSTARTHTGANTLAHWLTTPAAPGTVRERQAAVDELRESLDLREDLAVLAESAIGAADSKSLAAWIESTPQRPSQMLRIAALVFSVFGLVATAAGFAALFGIMGALHFSAIFTDICRDVFLADIVVGVLLLYRYRPLYEPVIGAVQNVAHDLNLLSNVLVRLEAETFHSPLLVRLRASLDTNGAPPSKRIAKLNRLMEWIDSLDNVFVRLISPLLLLPLHMAIAMEHWRHESGPALRHWLEATGEIEAICSLASHAFEHPDDPFPELVADGMVFAAEGIAHPLIPEARAVRNDVSFGTEPQVIIVSGSNMSGKSTLLRTIGVNAVLAQAGAPVRARRLRLSPMQPGASIRVTDSLQGGMSRFYAEIVRLRDILRATTGPLPVLFLLDEFLHGTNSHDRRIGAEAMVRGLVERGAIGLVTTHDLALAQIADHLGSRAANVHFEDRLEEGAMVFDYIMQPGIVRKSNAIELMRSVGLEI
jgi:hypothetical protein